MNLAGGDGCQCANYEVIYTSNLEKNINDTLESRCKNGSCKPLYYYGKRKFNIIHARLRMKCSEVTAHLYNMHI